MFIRLSGALLITTKSSNFSLCGVVKVTTATLEVTLILLIVKSGPKNDSVSPAATTPNGTTTTGITNNKALLGGLLGAAAGAGVSKATGGERTGRDAAIGGVLGAGVGYYMQQQEAKLRAQTAGSGVTVTRDPVTNNINLSIPEAITFRLKFYIRFQMRIMF
jgi:hypothetical protein